MEIEFVEFYPIERKKPGSKLIGTIHVYLCEEKIDIRGIKVFRCGRNCFVDVPYAVAWDKEEQKKVKYPYISFMDNDKQKDFIASLRKVASNELKKLFKKKGARKPHTKQPQKLGTTKKTNLPHS